MTDVLTEQGRLSTSDANDLGVRVWRGIAYAAPPVGDLRWRPPQPPPGWSGVRNARDFGPNAPQRILFDDIDPFAVGVSEDCLYLNVWSGADIGNGEKRPVLFWIHGGGFAVGSGAEPRYDGTQLAARGLVVVTVNTRLNALGFLAHPALTAETGASGNYALLDLIDALKWVKTNISAFGGDPDSVTIAGESAGSMFCSMLMGSPLAKGLFLRVIGQSGAEFPSPEKRTQTLAEAEDYGLAFMKKLGASSLAEMRNADVERLLDVSPGLGFWPVIDGHVLPAALPDIFAQGRQNDVDLIFGWNKDEGTNFSLSARGGGKFPFRDQVLEMFKSASQEVLRLYPAHTAAETRDSAKALGGDLVICQGAWAWGEAQRQRGTAALYRFRFDMAPAVPASWFPEDPTPGAFHSCEIPYVFNTLSAFDWKVSDKDRAAAEVTARYWVNFIKTGDPNGQGVPQWPSYREPDRPTLCITDAPHIINDPNGERHRLLARHARV